MSHGFKNKSKKTSYGSPFGPGAKLQIRAVGHAFEHNAIAWVENYRDTKLGSYSEEVARMGQGMHFTPYDEEAETEKYPIEEELYTSMSEWTPTLDQIRDLQAIKDAQLREFARVEMFHEWAAPRRERNIEIRKSNLKNAEALKRIPREAKKAKDMYAKIFQEMEADMSEGAREIVRRTTVQRKFTNDEGTEVAFEMTYEQAKERWDFIWVLEAALNGLVKRGADVDDIHEMHARKEDFRKKIKDFKQGTLEWNSYCIALKRLWENASLLGIEIDEAEKVAILMQNVNQDIFKHQLVAYHDPNQRRILGYFDSYDALVDALDAVVRSTPDAVIIRAQGRERRETSFVTEEKAEGFSKDLKQSCNICGAWGKYFHFARDCPLKHPKKSVSENIEYFKKNPKALEDKKRKLKEQRESGRSAMTSTKGSGGKSEKSAHTEHTLVSTTSSTPTVSSTAATSGTTVAAGATGPTGTTATVTSGGGRPSRSSGDLTLVTTCSPEP